MVDCVATDHSPHLPAEKLHELIAITLPDNHASRRVMEKASFAYDRDLEHAGLTHVLYRRGHVPNPPRPLLGSATDSRPPLRLTCASSPRAMAPAAPPRSHRPMAS